MTQSKIVEAIKAQIKALVYEDEEEDSCDTASALTDIAGYCNQLADYACPPEPDLPPEEDLPW